MIGKRLIYSWHIPGTLAANINIRFTAPFDMRLIHSSAVASNNSDATLILGISTDTDSILASTTIGDTNVPSEKTVANWATTNPTGQVYDGEVFCATLDFDGSSGTAAADATIVLTFLEG